MRKCLAWVFAALAGAASASTLCPEGGPIRFAHYEFGLLYAQGEGGIDADIQRELARRSGCRFVVDLRPRARIWMELESGELDMAGSGVQTVARDAFAWFAHYILEHNDVVLSPRVPVSVRGFDDLIRDTELHLGGVRSYSYSPYYDRQVDRLRQLGRVYEVGDARTLYRMFYLGRFDAVIASQFLYGYYFRELGQPLPPRIEDWDPAGGTPSGLVLSKRRFSPEQAKAWQGLVADMLADGTVQRIVRRYVGAADARRSVYAPPTGRP